MRVVGCLLLLSMTVLALLEPVESQEVGFFRGVYRGTRDMIRSYNDMRDANTIGADRFFHARGNRDAASHGSGGRFAASVISNTREFTDRLRGGSAADSASDQEANLHGRNGGNINRFRVNGIPERYQ